MANAPDLSSLSQAGSAQQSQQQPQAGDTQDQSQDQSQQTASQDDSTQDSSSQSDSGSSDDNANVPAGIHRAFSALNEKIIAMLDANGCKRSFTVPYAETPMAKHIQDVGTVAAQSGGLGNNLLVTAHHSNGKGFGSSDGHTVGYNADKLREIILPASGESAESAKAAIEACKSLITKISKLIGEYIPEVKMAKSQLALVGRANGRGMTLMDLAVVLLQIPGPALQALARQYAETHDGGAIGQLRGPHERKTPKSQQ
jgi:hypothetical protein